MTTAEEYNKIEKYNSFEEYLSVVNSRNYYPQLGERVVVWPPGRSFRGVGTVVDWTTNPPGTPKYPLYFVEYDHGGGVWIGSTSLYPEE